MPSSFFAACERRTFFARALAGALTLLLPFILLAALPSAAWDRSLNRVDGARDAAARLALVIGNGSYADSPLRNPANDARSMASALERFGFKVRLLVDADQRKLENAIRAFTSDLRDQRGIGLFYFAGHGMQIDGHNYLIPIGANIAAEHEVRYESVDVGRLMDGLVGAGSANVVILDACRNNPFARSFRSSRQGLASMDAPSNTLVAYATAPGLVAADGDGANGLYTEQLLDAMDTPGVPIEQVFKQVRREVEQRSNGRQTPWEESSLKEDIVFVPGAGTTQRAANPAFQAFQEMHSWGVAQGKNSCEGYREFLVSFPSSVYATLARQKVEKLCSAPQPPATTEPDTDEKKWQETVAKGTCGAYLDYSKAFPRGAHIREAERRIEDCAQEAAKSLALGFADEYYGALGRTGCDQVSRMWVYPPGNLCSMTENLRGFEVRNKRLVSLSMSTGEATVFVDVVGQRYGESPNPWQGCLDLKWSGERWRLAHQHAESSGPCAGSSPIVSGGRSTSVTGGGSSSGEQGVLNFAERYYAALGRADYSAVSGMWAPGKRPKSLRSLVRNVEWFQVDSKFVQSLSSSRARVAVDVTGKARGSAPKSYAMSLELVRSGGAWKLSRMRTR